MLNKIKEAIKTILQVIGILVWILGGGMLLAGLFIGLPILVIFLGIDFISPVLSWLWNSAIFQIIFVAVVGLLLIYGFTEKRKYID